MDAPQDFKLVVKLKLSELVEGTPTLTAAIEAMNRYIGAVRDIAAKPDNRKLRLQLLGLCDEQLVKDLSALSNTEHVEQPGQEQPGGNVAGDGQEQPGPGATDAEHNRRPNKRKPR